LPDLGKYFFNGERLEKESVLKLESVFDLYIQWPSVDSALELSSIQAIYQWMCLALDLREAFLNRRLGRIKGHQLRLLMRLSAVDCAPSGVECVKFSSGNTNAGNISKRCGFGNSRR
jgi:hypothetical protein